MSALLSGAAVFLAVMSVRPQSVAVVVGSYLASEPASPRRLRIRPPAILPGSVLGGVAGAVLLPVLWPVGMIVGAVAGALLHRLSLGRKAGRRGRRLGQELPAVADLLALYVLSGESVTGAIRYFCEEASGVAATEMSAVLARLDSGMGFIEAVRFAEQETAHPDAARLYELLGQAHRSGARLVDALAMFAADRRSALAGELAAEGGRRALTGYAPILGLMIPTTLVFLMYPTLAGLDALA